MAGKRETAYNGISEQRGLTGAFLMIEEADCEPIRFWKYKQKPYAEEDSLWHLM